MDKKLLGLTGQRKLQGLKPPVAGLATRGLKSPPPEDLFAFVKRLGSYAGDWPRRLIFRRALWTAAVLISVAAMGLGGADQPLETVAHVDLGRYVGKWYEIARYPNRFEKECARDVTAEYATLPNGKISVVNTCLKSDGKAKQSKGSAVVVDKASNAKLSVTFFWPFSGKYWILDLGPQYEYAVVGEPSRRYLWILSRSKSMPEEQYREITSRLAAKGYDADKLAKTTQ